MTTENTTESAVISRRTVLRTTANAAWLVPAITVANAVPAMAACSVHQAPHFSSVQANTVGPNSTTAPNGTRYLTRKFTVTSSGGAGTASLVVTLDKGPKLLLGDSTANFSVTADNGWAGPARTGSLAATGSKYTFTKLFSAGCGEQSVTTVKVTYNYGAGLTTEPKYSGVVTPA